MPEKPRQNEMDGMEPSIMSPKPTKAGTRTQEINDEDTYNPEPNSAPEYKQPPQSQQDYSENYVPQEESYTQDDYAPSYDSDIMIEIAEQVFLEKIKKIQKQVDSLTEFKTLTGAKVNDIAERLKRIETIIDKLQITILEKVGSYGKTLESTKKEMAMMQDSFRKVINKPKETSTKNISQK